MEPRWVLEPGHDLNAGPGPAHTQGHRLAGHIHNEGEVGGRDSVRRERT